ncbi:MAG TPA: hypothetical protein VHP38_13840, partial [Ruminiclostridium sp.]|nr:hypothetical protein [Ruminiclostridium sp.]
MPEYDKTSTLQKKYKLSKSNPSERKPSLKNSNPTDMIKRAELDPQSIMHADVMQLQKAVGNKLVYQLLAGIEQVNSRTRIPAVSPGNSAIIQKVDDPNGQLFKMFRDCAYKVRVSKFYIKESEIKKIIKDSGTVDEAFESWMNAVIKIQSQNGLLAVKTILPDEEIKKIMRAERQRIKSQRDKEELDARFVSPPPKDTTYDMEMEEKVPDGEMEEYMKSPTRDDQYEKMLEEGYTGIQAISSQTMDEAFEEQGWMNKGKITDKGQQLLNWAKANIGKDSMGITPIQQAFILTHFIPPKDGSLGMQPFPNSTVSLEINFQEAVSATVNSGVIPGVGTYDQHLDRMQKDPIDDLYFTNISGTKEERKARLVEKLKAKGYEDQKAAGMAEEIIKEEDKTRNLQFLEQTRNFEDQIATSMAFEGVNDIWSLNQGLGQRLNPMHNKSATSSINKIRMRRTGKALQDAQRVRKEITKTAKTTLKEAIVRTKRAKRTNPKMYLALRAVREYLKNPKS